MPTVKIFSIYVPPATLNIFTVYGTVLDGEKKKITETLMGVSCSSFFQQLRGLCSWLYWFFAIEEGKKIVILVKPNNMKNFKFVFITRLTFILFMKSMVSKS